ncbi:MAG: hypothetical protein ACLGJB_18555 [Blastocatellia bacterium]
MKRTRGLMALASFAVAIMLSAPAAARQPHKAVDSYKKNSGRVARQPEQAKRKALGGDYTPHVEGRSLNLVIEGRITSLEGNVITIKTARGARFDLVLDQQTTVFGSGELVSIATMADITLSPSDLRVSDTVEVVTEHIGQRQVARIITRIASSDAQVAKR